jgi:hypothetical protein
MSELIWIAVPGGRLASGKTSLAVVIVPRLAGEGNELAGYGMDRWPERLHAASFQLEVRGAGTGGSIVPKLALPTAEMLLNWTAMFRIEPAVEDREQWEPWVEVRPYATPTEFGVPDILRTTAEADALRSVYAKEVAGQDWSAELRTLRTTGAGRRARAARGTVTNAVTTKVPPDFHEKCAFLREHPRVLRALGLIVDFEVDLPDGVRAVRVVPQLPSGPAASPLQAMSPWTCCTASNGHILPQPRRPDLIHSGMVAMGGANEASGNPNWAVVTFDVDAAMTRIHAADGTVEEDQVLPGLRSAGLLLLRPGRQEELHGRLGSAARSSRGTLDDNTELYAEDLVLGYRVDVLDEGSSLGWQPLCRRQAEYLIGDRSLGTAIEEAQVKADAMTAAPAKPGRTDGEEPTLSGLEGDEQVTRWDGWSLAVPRPAPRRRKPSPSPFGLAWKFAAEAPLPALRFHRDYRLRARVAYLGGMGLSTTDADLLPSKSAQATRPIFYGRVEPIPAPVVMPPPSLGPGEGIDRLVVRSLGGVTSEPGSFADTDHRLLCAPPISIELADQHGVFDNHEDDPELSWQLARRAMPGLDGHDEHGRTAQAGQPVAWLPDPLARKWVVRSGNTELRAAWAPQSGALPESSFVGGPIPVTLELTRGVAPWSHAAGRVSISLPPAEQLDVEVASIPHPSDIDQLTLQKWMTDQAAGVGGHAQVVDGRHPHITPARRLQLVHAVQQPLVAPAAELVATRGSHDTFATITAVRDLVLDRRSTVRLDVTAEWREWGDGPEPIGPPQAAIVASDKVGWIDEPWDLEPKRHEFGDTRHRRVTYTLTAVSRFQEYFPDSLIEADPAAFCTKGPPIEVPVPSSARPVAPSVLLTLPAFAWQGGDAQPGWQEWERSRRGGLVRVRLDWGWNSSGEGEQLAVVVTPRNFPSEALRPFLTQAGRDPIRSTARTGRYVLGRDIAGGSARLVEVWLEEAQDHVLVIPFTPAFSGPLGYVDIDLGAVAASSYCPFVQLALARYQPCSIERHHLSPVVRTEMVQLLPDRHLRVSRSQDPNDTVAGLIAVSLDGASADDSPNPYLAWIERWTGRPGEPVGQPTTELAAIGDIGDPRLRSWVRVTGLRSSVVGGEAITFETVSLIDSAPHRVVIVEVEDLEREHPEGVQPEFSPFASRVIFTDTVPLRDPEPPPEPLPGGE